MIYDRSHSPDTAFPPTPHRSPSHPGLNPEEARTTTPSRPNSPKSWAGRARHAGTWSLGVLHLPQEPVKGGGWKEKMECGCGGSSPQGLFPRSQAFPSSAEAEGHMLTHCPSPRSGNERAPSPTPPASPTELCSSRSDVQPGVVPGWARAT